MASEILVHAISKALDGLTLRETVTAQNIANANSPSYVPLRVSFEGELANAVVAARARSANPSVIDRVQAHIVQDPLAVADEPMRVDQELVTSSQTSMRYAALLSVLDRVFEIKNVVTSGN